MDMIGLFGACDLATKNTSAPPLQAVQAYWLDNKRKMEVYTIRGNKVYKSVLSSGLAIRTLMYMIRKRCGRALCPVGKSLIFS